MIRKARLDDFPLILAMCEEFWHHSGFEEGFDSQHVMAVVRNCYLQDLLLVVDIDGVVEGFSAATRSYLLGSREAKVGTELAWWINPAVRKEGWGVELMTAMEVQAKLQGIKHWNMAYMVSSMPEEVKAMYESQGYSLREAVYSKVL